MEIQYYYRLKTAIERELNETYFNSFVREQSQTRSKIAERRKS